MKLSTGRIEFSIILASALWFAQSAAAGTGNTFMKHIRAYEAWKQDGMLEDSYAVGYVQGMVRGVVYTRNGEQFCVPEDPTSGQWIAVVSKWMQENPEWWNEPDAVLVSGTLQITWPCH